MKERECSEEYVVMLLEELLNKSKFTNIFLYINDYFNNIICIN